MTPPDGLVEILRASSSVLLDFDGPLTRLLPDGAGIDLAHAARDPLIRAEVSLPEQVATTTDHLAVLRFAATQSDTLRDTVESVCTVGELAAAQRSIPTPGAQEALEALHAAGRPVVVVSNNAQVSVNVYLKRHNLDGLVHAVVGRTDGHPDLMKPNPSFVLQALRILDAGPDDAVMVGDSVTDIQVSRHVGMRSIGYAKTPRRGAELAQAGADAIITDMAALGEAAQTASPCSG